MSDSQANSDQSVKKDSMLGRSLVAAVVGLVIMGEIFVTYMLLPSQAELAASMEASVGTTEGGEDGDPTKLLDLTPMAEIDLGHYSIAKHVGSTNTTLRIDFRLIGTVLPENSVQVQEVLAINQHRLREKVLLEVRAADVNDLMDPGLGLIKRRILEKSNDLFGDSVFRGVVFSDFSFMEQ